MGMDRNCKKIDLIRGSHPPKRNIERERERERGRLRKREIKRERERDALNNELVYSSFHI